MFFKTLKQKLDLRKFHPFRGQRGQSLVEMAIAAPIMLIMLIGVLEVGWALRGYLVLANVNREATRFAVKTGTLDYSDPYKDVTKVGYDKVLSHTLASLAGELPLEYFGPETNNTMIISHFVADTQLPCSDGDVPYEFDPSCDCTVDDPNDPQWFTADDFTAHPGDPLFPHYAMTFGIERASRLDYETQIAEMKLLNNQTVCALLKANPNASLANTANNMVVIENFYAQAQIAGVPFISNQLTDPIPFYTHTTMRIVCSRDGCTESIGPSCEIYPITFPETLLPDPEHPITDYPVEAFEGDGEGNFGWLNWDPGDNSNGYIIEELHNPRLSMEDFKGLTPPPSLAEDDTNTDVNLGDWISGSTGVNTSSGVQDQLDGLIGKPIRVPVYDIGEGTGSNKGYHVSHFALITINKICLPNNQCGQDLGLNGNQKAIFATFHRYDDMACSAPDDPGGPDARNDDYRDTPMNRDAAPRTLDVLDNDSGDNIRIVSVIQPDQGTVEIIDSGRALRYTPRDHNHGVGDWSFNYTIEDSEGVQDWGTVRVRVVESGANTPPTANDKTLTVDKNTNKAFTLTGNDVDGDSLTYRVKSPPAHGTLVGNILLGGAGGTYQPDFDYVGSDSFTFDVFDGTVYSAEATVTIEVIGNHNPVANNQSVSTTIETSLNITLTGSDADGDSLTYTIVDSPGHGTLTGTKPNLTYTPENGYTGPDSFTFKANDGQDDSNVATVLIAVGIANQVPVGENDTVTTTINTAIDIDVGGNDYDPDDPINPLIFGDFTGASHGTTVYQGAGVVRYTPDTGFVGVDTFTYNVTDSANDTVNVTVTVYVIEATNQAPIAADDSAATQQGSAVTLNFSSYLANDSDPDNDSLTITGVSGAVNGQVTMDAGSQTITFTPNAGFSGNGSFTYTVSDGNGGTDTATVTIRVNAPPVAVDDNATTNKNVAVVINVLSGDSDPDGDMITVSAVDPTTSQGGSVVNNNDGTVTFSPKSGFKNATDTFTYTISDGKGGTDTATVSVYVNP